MMRSLAQSLLRKKKQMFVMMVVTPNRGKSSVMALPSLSFYSTTQISFSLKRMKGVIMARLKICSRSTHVTCVSLLLPYSKEYELNNTC